MSGPITLKTQKGLLTRYSNNLRRVLDSAEATVTREWSDLHERRDLGNTQAAIFELQSASELVLNSLSTFAATADSLGESLNEEHEKQLQEYIDSAQSLLDRANRVAIQMDAHVRTARDQTLFMGNDQATFQGTLQVARPKLPAIPIPTFSGKVWEYKNFWTLFCANVHDQPLTKLQKFNYLLNALSGEARELVKRYSVTEDNYDLAVESLRKKYGDNSKLIDRLQARLEAAKAEDFTTQAQRRLLEFIVPIVAQLEQENVNLDGSYLTKKVLAKFNTSTQRRILDLRLSQETNESNWKMQDLLKDLDQHISKEERINDMVKSKNTTHAKLIPKHTFGLNSKNQQCMFCSSMQHKSLSCSQYPTISERRTAMQERKLCLNCGKSGHFATQCKSQGCRNCKGTRHHHTLCPQLAMKKDINPKQWTPEKRLGVTQGRQESKTRYIKTKEGKTINTHANPLQSDQLLNQERAQTITSTAEQETTVLQNTDKTNNMESCVLLLTGCAKIWNCKTQEWDKVEILFDTGADRSFISEALAKRIGLKYSDSRKLRMQIFGIEEPKVTICNVTALDIWDFDGHKYPVQLYTTPVLTGMGKAVHLTEADQAFIKHHAIQLSKATQDDQVSPQILLGCDQLWNFLDSTCPQLTLPSGLRLIPSRLGYLLTGRQTRSEEQIEKDMHADTEAMIKVNSFTNFDEDLQRWDKYWTMDSSGICEFTGTKDAEKKAINEKVLQFFNRTIERRKDGYYVRFPYKENHPSLPSNKAIALKRLESVLTMLRLRPDTLKEYENTITTQKEIGIIEEIPNNFQQEGKVLHYIPHQPVITPHKETTKLRIVFDASAHFSNCPSLNDVLHQGPLILPELYEVLLRFRVPQYVVTSDVEKAFLQVRLNELDRDATRFFWVRDTNKPVDEDNLVTYRFTRVTFGLNVSPFLLAGTIHYHLHFSVENEEIAEEIRENLYVDNLILAGNSEKEVHEKALESRQIFAEMGTNLREFLSNDSSLRKQLPQEACAKSISQVRKILRMREQGD
uniref:CCHC-type domain-containing protein n=1 Tax=Haemonchus contortus TaxID=6289 RepID=A0A7I4Y2Q8_HAECO